MNMQAQFAAHFPGFGRHAGASQAWLAFGRLLRRRLLHVAALTVALASSEVLSGYSTLIEAEALHVHGWFILVFGNRALSTLLIVAGLSAAQIWILRTHVRRVVMALAIVLIAMSISAAQQASFWPLSGPRNSGATFFLYLVWLGIATGTLAAVLYEWQWDAETVMEAVRAASIADEAAERRILESRLAAMKARIDPQFLFASIRRAQSLYPQDPDTAERLLQRLIEFLRATLPAHRDAPVTLGQEIELCNAYMEIQKLLRQGGLDHRVATKPAILSDYFPPSVLLPLLHSLLPRGSASAHLKTALTAVSSSMGIRVELSCAPASLPLPDDAIEACETVLRGFFGERASISIGLAANRGASICVEVRHAAS